MKNLLSKSILVSLSLILFSTQCDDDINSPNQEDEQQELTVLKTEIEDLANASVCNETSECKSIAFGSKPCGGPWSYLVYSTSIDTGKLENLVETYNDKEAAFNTKWGIASDCALAQQPTGVNCENNTCVAVF